MQDCCAPPPPGAAWRLAPLWQPFSAAAWVGADPSEARAGGGRPALGPGQGGSRGARRPQDWCSPPAVARVERAAARAERLRSHPFPAILYPGWRLPKDELRRQSRGGPAGAPAAHPGSPGGPGDPGANTLPYPSLSCGRRPRPREVPRTATIASEDGGTVSLPRLPPRPATPARPAPQPPAYWGCGKGVPQRTEMRTCHSGSSGSFAF